MKGDSTMITLSKEQENFIKLALSGKNILVDACIGSGKTTSIQQLCTKLTNKKVLYLTYNRLLKVDAKNKIKLKNVAVHNYDGFAYWRLSATGNKIPSTSDLVMTFNRILPEIYAYDVLIIDEYQDIKEEHAVMLNYIKSKNPNMQIVAVGDMKQKIYDNTTLDVEQFIEQFLIDYEMIEFTQCFRLSKDLAETLGRIWKKPIRGVNNNCKVSHIHYSEVVSFLADKEISNILCLGARTGDMARTLNKLESHYPDKFNKHTVYASIRDNDVVPDDKCAIFTTFDASKGLERPICVIFDFSEEYWETRISKPQTKYEILRNVFCVAASRGKYEIVFVHHNGTPLSEKTLSNHTNRHNKFDAVNMSEMFDYKFKEDIEECYQLLNIEVVRNKTDEIDIKSHDGLIDLGPCIGIYQEAIFFENYNIDEQIDLLKSIHGNRTIYVNDDWSLEKKILAVTSFETNQKRYIKQVKPPFITEEQKQLIKSRLSTIFKTDETVQQKCQIIFKDDVTNNDFVAKGRCDVFKDNCVYELKFTSALSHEHFLQCASYIIGLNIEVGYLWNVRTDEMYRITIPNKEVFLKSVKRTITKRCYK